MVSKKSSTFAPAFEKALPNCVMVALQILVLSVWVRVLVRQQKKKRRSSLFFLCEPALTQRFLALKGTIITYLVSLERLLHIRCNFRVLVLCPEGHDYFGNTKKETLKSLFFVRTGSHPEVLSPNGHDYHLSRFTRTIIAATEKKAKRRCLAFFQSFFRYLG